MGRRSRQGTVASSPHSNVGVMSVDRVATNQCLGGLASCVNIAERLNHQLRHCKSKEVCQIDNAAFSVTMSGTEARLYVSWKHDELPYYMATVGSYLL